MFRVETTASPPAEPRQSSFEARLRTLLRSRFRVMYFYETPDSSTFRYRVHNVIEVMRESDPGIGMAWFCRDDLPRLRAALPRMDVLVLCRTRYSQEIAELVLAARAMGARVLFDVDDLVFDNRYTHLILETLSQKTYEAAWDHWFAYIGRMGAGMRLCDGVIVTNAFLAERARDFSGLACHIVPNFLNDEQVVISGRLLAEKEASGFARDDRIHVGYFSGTPTHLRDFALAIPALDHLLTEDPRVILRLVGYIDPGERLARHAARIERHPLQDFVALQRLIGSTEINIVPLQDNLFTNCKSELKVFEASVAGTLSVASPSYTLSRAIEDGRTGFLAQAHEWDAMLRRAIATLDDGRYPAMARAAAQATLDRFAPQRQVAAIRAALLSEGA